MTTERDLGKAVVAHLRDEGWDVYQEVLAGGPIADVVATSGPVIHVVELKKTLSLELMAQAEAWLKHAHLVSVAIPRPRRRSRGWWFAERHLQRLGVGVLFVWDNGEDVSLQVGPALRRRVSGRLRDALHPDQRTALAAGSVGGGYSTPFKRFVGRLVVEAKKEPGLTLQEALTRADHHYSTDASARAQVSRLVRRGVIEGVELRKKGRRLTLHPKGGRG